jgi:hypothetical protein
MDGEQRSTVLPNEWVAALFRRFRVIYGSRLDTMWVGTKQDELTAAWAAELGPFEAADIKLALEALRHSNPEFPPSLFEFRNLCKEAMRSRIQTVPKLPSIRYRSVAPEVLAAIHELTKDPINRKRDPKDWARKILQREAAGERLPIYALTSAREVLGV